MSDHTSSAQGQGESSDAAGQSSRQQQQQRNGLPVPIHPDDAKDKVFTAILKALIKMGNKPSSPKELANVIVKYKYATLGGATPFATVSSRISQHFKRAAEHNPPRPPLLARHFDEHHSRKINYSLATEPAASALQQQQPPSPPLSQSAASSSSTTQPPTTRQSTRKRQAAATSEDHTLLSDISPLSSEDESRSVPQQRRQTRQTTPPVTRSARRRARKQRQRAEKTRTYVTEQEADDESENEVLERNVKRVRHHRGSVQSSLPLSPVTGSSSSSFSSFSPPSSSSTQSGSPEKHKGPAFGQNGSVVPPASPPTGKDASDEEESEAEYSDYYEEMLKGDEAMADVDAGSTSSAPPTIATRERRRSSINAMTGRRPSIAQVTTAELQKSISAQSSMLATGNHDRRQSFSLNGNGNLMGDEFWNNYEHDFDTVFMSDESTAHRIPPPESMSVAELDTYFNGDKGSAKKGNDDRNNHQESSQDCDAKDNSHCSSSSGKKHNQEQVIVKVEPPSPTMKKSTPATTVTTTTQCGIAEDDDGNTFVKFEEDEDKKPNGTTNLVTNIGSVVTPSVPINTPLLAQRIDSKEPDSTPQPSAIAADFLKMMTMQNFNMAAFQQMTAAIPGLPPNFDLAKSLTAYMQSLAKASSTSANSSTVQPGINVAAPDLKAALAKFPALEALFKKDPALNGNGAPSTAVPATGVNAFVNTTDPQQQVVHTTAPTDPPMYITVVDNIAVCVAILKTPNSDKEFEIMRRLDSGYINGTMLLTAGGIDTESERSMILSFEMERIRMPKKKSPLYGTWIPLRRAQELAATCSIQHRLGPFLEESIESYFPSPLPITIPVTRRAPKDGRLAALAMQALRHGSSKPGYLSPSAMSRSLSPPSQAAQLHQLLLGSSSRGAAEYTLKAPLLGEFEDDDEDGSHRRISIIDSSTSASRRSSASKGKQPRRKRVNKDDGGNSDVDIVNSGGSEEDDDGGDTDTDADIEEVRLRMKKMRDAAIEAMGSGSSFDLEELLRRASSPIRGSSDSSFQSNTRSHRTSELRRSGSSKGTTGRRRPLGGATAKGNHSVSGKIAPSALKKSASWSGTLSSPSPLRVVVPAKKLQAARKNNNSNNSRAANKTRNNNKDEEVVVNRVVEHNSSSSSSLSQQQQTPSPSVTTSIPATSTTTTTTANNNTITNDSHHAGSLTTIQEDDDEDEEIDIGGSDRDDDLR